MKKAYLFLILLGFLVLSCNNEIDEQGLIGEWSTNSIRKDNLSGFPLYRPFGIAFGIDSVELFNGFMRYEENPKTELREFNYKGNFTKYKVIADSIYIIDPFSHQWEFRWKIKKQHKETLVLIAKDSSQVKLQKVRVKPKIDFDQIILSRTGCFGWCPIIDISIDSRNRILFQGEGFVDPLGFYESSVNSTTTDFVFSKFGKTKIESLTNKYSVSHSDDESIITTFIKDGRIIKTILDYGKAGPKELIWAYIPLENLYSQIVLDSIPDDPFYPKLHYFTFEKNDEILELEKSESFFLWTELRKAKVVDKSFSPEYTVGFRRNFTYWSLDPKENKAFEHRVTKIESDGRFYRFSFGIEDPIVYDLGYNFIDRNFKEFRAK